MLLVRVDHIHPEPAADSTADHALLAEPTETTHRFSGLGKKPEQIQQQERRFYIPNHPYDHGQSRSPDVGERHGILEWVADAREF